MLPRPVVGRAGTVFACPVADGAGDFQVSAMPPSAMERQIARPSPVPSVSRPRAGSTR